MKNKIIILFLTYCHMSYAAKVLPEFSGKWFDETTRSTPIDSCYMPHWSYKNISFDKEAVVKTLFTDLPPLHSCEWQAPHFYSYSEYFPEDFPTTDIDVMITGEKAEVWAVDCKGPPPDNVIWESIQKVVYPSYQCPQGSRLASDETGTFCSTTPNVCVADIAGRELDTIVLGKMGHVGLTAPLQNESRPLKFGNYVLEVLNQDVVINVNTMQSFEHAVENGYWGEVYGLDPSGFVPFTPAVNAIRAGVSQSAFDPEYTLTTDWQEGHYQNALVYDSAKNQFIDNPTIVRAKFRCDTFVNYCYAKGFGNFIEDSGVMLPRVLYGKFLFQRLDVPLQFHASAKKDFSEFDAY